jgi:hypothetical protein
MTDRHAAYLVVLRDDIRDDDANAILTALRMVSGVASVQPVIADYSQVIARGRRDVEWTEAIGAMVRQVLNHGSP